MFKLTHKRQRADEERTRGLIGIPCHVVGLLLSQVLSGPGFADFLFLSVASGLSADMDAQQ